MIVTKPATFKRAFFAKFTLESGDTSPVNLTLLDPDVSAGTGDGKPKDFLGVVKVKSTLDVDKTAGVKDVYNISGADAGKLTVTEGTTGFATGDKIIVQGTFIQLAEEV